MSPVPASNAVPFPWHCGIDRVKINRKDGLEAHVNQECGDYMAGLNRRKTDRTGVVI
jgi:hypothetical protein